MFSPLTNKRFKALEFREMIARELHEKTGTSIQRTTNVNPFKDCKNLLTTLHGELMAKHSLRSKAGYKEPRLNGTFVFNLPKME